MSFASGEPGKGAIVIRSEEDRFDAGYGVLSFVYEHNEDKDLDLDECVLEACNFGTFKKVMEGLGKSKPDTLALLSRWWGEDRDSLEGAGWSEAMLDAKDRLIHPFVERAWPEQHADFLNQNTFRAFFGNAESGYGPFPTLPTELGSFLMQYWVSVMQKVPPAVTIEHSDALSGALLALRYTVGAYDLVPLAKIRSLAGEGGQQDADLTQGGAHHVWKKRDPQGSPLHLCWLYDHWAVRVASKVDTDAKTGMVQIDIVSDAIGRSADVVSAIVPPPWKADDAEPESPREALPPML